MNHDDNCIFCKIVKGTLPSVKVFEDAHTFAFMDINPVGPGHVLIIPKAHHADIASVPAELLQAVIGSVQRVAHACNSALQPEGMNIMQANGAVAGQTVFHLHFHVIPRWDADTLRLHIEGGPAADSSELVLLAERLSVALT